MISPPCKTVISGPFFVLSVIHSSIGKPRDGRSRTGHNANTRSLAAVLRKLTLSVFAALVLAGCGSNDYWYCWDSDAPAPHHLGHQVSGDHLCSDSELDANPPPD